MAVHSRRQNFNGAIIHDHLRICVGIGLHYVVKFITVMLLILISFEYNRTEYWKISVLNRNFTVWKQNRPKPRILHQGIIDT
jgi:hypothetical protein